MIPSLEEIKRVFFAAMLAGYANSESKAVTLKELPGYKIISFTDEIDPKFTVTDTYTTTLHSNMSSGMTVICYDGYPVWDMHYGGFYHEKALPFLKDCLLRNYSRGIFRGGRGPVFVLYEESNLKYSNRTWQSRDGDIEKFEGEESIENINSGEQIGYHWFCGGSLLKNQNFLI
jgi:hypothetical protein